MKTWVLVIMISFLSVYSFAQNDSSKVVPRSEKIDNEINVKKSTDQLKAKSASSKVNPNSNVDLKVKNKLNTAAINRNLDQNKSSNNQNFLLETLPEDKDIIGLEYWKGKDVTHNKIESHLSLGTINSTSKTVKIECRDHSYIDGDRIRIYLNEKVVHSNIGLKGNYYVVYINLEPGYNRIDFQALNQGLSGPNTAELKVYDDRGNLISAKDWNLPTGYIATLGIIKKQE